MAILTRTHENARARNYTKADDSSSAFVYTCGAEPCQKNIVVK